jgi:DNA-binding CsgD family transcriptional regulator
MHSTKFDSANEFDRRGTQIPDARLLETVLARKTPDFYIIDRDLKVHLRRGDAMTTANERLPHDIAAAVKPVLSSTTFDSAIVPLHRDLALRVMRLHGGDDTRYALFFEPYRGRDVVEAAARKFSLTVREGAVLDLVLRGASTSEIAASLHITDGTVHQHVKNLGAKIGVTRRNAIVATVLGLIAA